MDLTESLQTCVENILPAANERKITVKFDIERPLLLTADKGEIEIILNNLLSNGVKYNREEGHIEVNIEERDTKYVLTVADTGIGMSQDECDRLFEEFVRIRNKKTRDIPGSGLGLSIVRRLARLYGGDATVKSEPDVGTTFSVTLEKNLLPE
jgi:signal transduction histidine kinase